MHLRKIRSWERASSWRMGRVNDLPPESDTDTSDTHKIFRKSGLKGGYLLRQMIKMYHERVTEEGGGVVLKCLRCNDVLVPCEAKMSEEDVERMLGRFFRETARLRAKINFTFVREESRSERRKKRRTFLPIPAESLCRKMSFAVIEMPFMDLVGLAKRNKNVDGISVDPFASPCLAWRDHYETPEFPRVPALKKGTRASRLRGNFKATNDLRK